MFARNLIKQTGRRSLSFKVCLECTTNCSCIETKSCVYNDFKYHYVENINASKILCLPLPLPKPPTEFEVVYYYN